MALRVRGRDLDKLARVDQDTKKIYIVKLIFQLRKDCLQKFDIEVYGFPRF